MPLNSTRFWLLIGGILIGIAAVVGVVIKPEAADAIIRVSQVVLGLVGVGVYSDGQRKMGDRPAPEVTE